MEPYLSDSSSPLSSPPPTPDLDPYMFDGKSFSDQCGSSFASSNADMAPAEAPVKRKRRPAQPKPRISRHLNLLLPAQETQSEYLDLLVSSLRNKRKIVVVAGAGISVSAGIPDFRSSHGLFKTLRKDQKLRVSGKELFDASVYQDSKMTSSFHDMVRSLSDMATKATPSAFHDLLARLADEGRLLRLYTQNIDGIDTRLPSLNTKVPLNVKGPWPRTIQLHGGLEKMLCQKCRHTSDFQPELFQGPDPPACPKCSQEDCHRTETGQRSRGIGKLRPRIVLYHEHNPDEEAIGSVVRADLRSRPDAIVVVGTSLKIPGVRRIVKEMCRVVRGRRDGVAMWLNHDAPPVGKDFEQCWDLVIKGDCDTVARLVDANPQPGSCDGMVHQTSTVNAEPLKFINSGIKVVIPPSSSFDQDQLAMSPLNLTTAANPPASKVTKRPQPRKPARPKKAQQQRDITQNFRVSKATKPSGPKVTKPLLLDEAPSTAMRPLSPGEPRNNGPQCHDLQPPSGMIPWNGPENPPVPDPMQIEATKISV